MRQITARELHAWLSDEHRANPVLIDVREPWEFERCRIAGSRMLPMRSLPARVGDLDAAAQTVLICHHGVRSYQVGMFLEQQGFEELYNLSGGLAAWARDVDPSMPTY